MGLVPSALQSVVDNRPYVARIRSIINPRSHPMFKGTPSQAKAWCNIDGSNVCLEFWEIYKNCYKYCKWFTPTTFFIKTFAVHNFFRIVRYAIQITIVRWMLISCHNFPVLRWSLLLHIQIQSGPLTSECICINCLWMWEISTDRHLQLKNWEQIFLGYDYCLRSLELHMLRIKC